MKNISLILILALLFIANIPGCKEEPPEIKDEWVEIDSIIPNQETAEKLNSILVSGLSRLVKPTSL